MPGVFSQNSLDHAVAGSAGTVLATLLLFPLERLKTLLQVGEVSGVGLLGILLRVLRKDGPRGLYYGCKPMLQTVGASNFLYFFLFEGLKEPLATAARRPEGEVGPYETLASSAIAGALNMAVTEPLWRACVVAQAESCDASAFRTVCRMWTSEGPGALWRGLGSSLWLVTNPVIQFFVYDALKALRWSATEFSSIDFFVMGAMAKAVATVTTFPLQVAQSRLRTVKQGVACCSSCPELKGMIPCMRSIFQKHGMGGLYTVLLPKMLQTVTQAAFMFAFYEKIHWVITRWTRRSVKRLARRMRRLR